MAQVVAYLTFEGNCREAMQFYTECLGGELTVQTVGDSPMAGQMPESAHGSVMHSVLNAGETTLFASDMLAPREIVHGNNVTLCITGKDKEEVRTLFDRLSAGAKITQPLTDEFFGLYGSLTDRYGINWMFQAA